MIRKASLLACTLSVMVLAHTPDETNSIVRAMLGNALFSLSDNMEANAERDVDESTSTWNGFLGRGEMDGWTQQERKDAFAWYLSDIATNDCTSLSALEEAYVRVAVKKCGVLNFAEATPSLKAMALNRRGIYRDRAISLTIKFSGINNEDTVFVENIVTNIVTYSRAERGVAVGAYSAKLLALNPTNEILLTHCDYAVRMLYRHRQCGLAGVNMLDNLFSARIEGYAMSSNRLEFANFVLGHPDARDFNIRKFTSVTNQLLSSGQPLVQLDIDDGE